MQEKKKLLTRSFLNTKIKAHYSELLYNFMSYRLKNKLFDKKMYDYFSPWSLFG